MKVLAIVLLSLAFNKAYTSPVPQCSDAAVQSPPPCAGAASPPEVYLQNNGQPVVIYATADQASSDGGASCADTSAALNLAPVSASAPSPCDASSVSASASAAPAQSDLEQAQLLADQSAADANSQPIQTVPASDQPCRVETKSQVVQQPGETFVHHPGPIYINQPPTRLVINHAPFVIRPSPVVLNQGGKTVTKQFTTKFLPSPIQVRPVIVRVVKPIEKKVLIEKPGASPGTENYVVPPPAADACAIANSIPSAASQPSPYAYAPVAYQPSSYAYDSAASQPSSYAYAPVAYQPSSYASAPAASSSCGNEIDLSQAGNVELQSDSLGSEASSCGCGL